MPAGDNTPVSAAYLSEGEKPIPGWVASPTRPKAEWLQADQEALGRHRQSHATNNGQMLDSGLRIGGPLRQPVSEEGRREGCQAQGDEIEPS